MNHKRVLLKISGASLGNDKNGFDINVFKALANQIKELINMDIKVAVVIGGGNVWRGSLGSNYHLNPEKADYLGMTSTLYNSYLLDGLLKQIGVKSVVYSALKVEKLTKKYFKFFAKKDLENGKVVILAGGTGKPFCTTDTAASLRAYELGIDTILMGKNGVDGVYSDDPRTNKKAIRYEHLTYQEVLEKKLKVVDEGSIQICQKNNIKMLVFNINDMDNISKAVQDNKLGTLIEGE